MTTKIGSRASHWTVTKGVGAVLGVGVLGALLSAHASAACVDPNAASGQGALHQSPVLSLHAPSAAIENFGGAQGAERIVGTWQVSYAAGGTVYGEAFIQWHSDGTEWENIDFPVLGGNICMGSWKVVGYDKVSRYHVGWLYTDGVVSGHFVETETDVLSRDGNSYTGTNDTKMYMLNGTMFNEVVGTSAATRIEP
jgi:hypothetical protein